MIKIVDEYAGNKLVIETDAPLKECAIGHIKDLIDHIHTARQNAAVYEDALFLTNNNENDDEQEIV